MAGLHAQELHRRLRGGGRWCSAARHGAPASDAHAAPVSAPDRPARPLGRAASPAEHVHRPGPRRSRAARPAPPRPRSAWPRRAASSGSCRARGAPRAPRSACSRTRARRRRGGARPGSPRAARRRRRRRPPASRWPPGDHDGGRPERVHRARELRRRAASGAAAGQRARLGHVRRDDGRARHQPRPERLLGVLVEQPRAALGDHHRVEHHRRARHEVERPAHGLDRLGGPEHPDLDRVDADVLGDRADLLDDQPPAGAGSTARDRHRVLRRDRGDRGHPVHAAARERLEVGLDAGAAAGVRAGDREHPGNATVRGHGQGRIGGRQRRASVRGLRELSRRPAPSPPRSRRTR